MEILQGVCSSALRADPAAPGVTRGAQSAPTGKMSTDDSLGTSQRRSAIGHKNMESVSLHRDERAKPVFQIKRKK